MDTSNQSRVASATESIFLKKKKSGPSNHGASETAPTRTDVLRLGIGLHVVTVILTGTVKKKSTSRSSVLATAGNFNPSVLFIEVSIDQLVSSDASMNLSQFVIGS